MANLSAAAERWLRPQLRKQNERDEQKHEQVASQSARQCSFNSVIPCL